VVRSGSRRRAPRTLAANARTKALAQKLPISIQPQKLNSAKISFFKPRPVADLIECREQCDKRKTCPRRAVGMAPGVFAHGCDPHGSISDVPESAARMTA